jgi:hypothetical protein
MSHQLVPPVSLNIKKKIDKKKDKKKGRMKTAEKEKNKKADILNAYLLSHVITLI